MSPPPPPDVAAQMQQSAPPMDIAALMGQLSGGQSMPSADITMKVLQVEPLLGQVAMQAPVLAPSVDQLLGEMKSRMGGMAMAVAGMAGPAMGGAPGAMGPTMQPGAPMPGGPPAPMAVPPPVGAPAPIGAPVPMDAGMGEQGPGGPVMTPPPPPPMGLMDLAMQLEIQLPAIGAADPTLLPNIQYFIAKMREEVPKIVNGTPDDQMASMAKNNQAPTDAMLKQLPVVA